MVEQAHAQYYQQMPPPRHASLMQGLLQGLTQRGVNPAQAGIQNTDLSRMSPQKGARLTSYTQQQQPGLLQQVMGTGGSFGSSGPKLAVASVVAFAPSRC